jgi:DNA polymerase
MRVEMRVSYWGNLPEVRFIRPLIAQARQRTDTMIATGQTAPKPRRQRAAATAAPPPGPADPLAALREEAASCRRCPLWEHATQTVFGEGAEDAPVMFVGEQPGDQEDLQGRPFVGPAGRMFDRALAEAGVDRGRAYVTNAVKHFKFVPRGKRRLHAKPNSGEVIACRFWLSREIATLRPRLIVALGATAAQSLFGRPTPVGSNRGRVTETAEAKVLVTVHPSYLLRLPDAATQESEYARFVADLRLARPFLGGAARAR